MRSLDHRLADGSRVLCYSGDDARSKADVGALISRLGFAGIDLGSISVGDKLVKFPGRPLSALNLVKFGCTIKVSSKSSTAFSQIFPQPETEHCSVFERYRSFERPQDLRLVA